MATPFSNIRIEAGDRERSATWYQKTVRNVANGVNQPNEVFGSDLGEYATRLEVGQMYTFQYDPKHKETLPYYDTFPLVIIADPLPTGFSGINLHYISPMARAKLLGKLMDQSESELSEKSKMLSAWSFIRNFSKFPEVRNSIKKYLTSQTGRMYKVSPVHWKSAIFLNTQQFVGATDSHVYRTSMASKPRKRRQV
jgi:hypothetical protein|tara:strand:+ start:91 stop:678 length:588 start_codon:yes stop_codon:yes gene_type:complete